MLRKADHPRVSGAAMDAALAELHRRLGPSKLRTGREVLEAYAGDESEQEPVLPDVVVVAETPDDVDIALSVAHEHAVPITPRGGGSGKSGGAVPVAGGIVLSTAERKAIVEIDREELIAVVEPGVVLEQLHEAVEAEGLFYPPDANSLSWCTLGGNVAENAGGPRAFKYGVTRDYVLGLEVSLADGRRMSVGRRTKKGVTGYDVTGLLVGSEGTLAVTQSITVRLLRRPATVFTALALFDDVRRAGRAVSQIVGAGLVPRCIELLDDATLAAVRARGVGVDEGARAMLLIEVDGEPNAAERELEEVGGRCDDVGASTVLAAQDEAQRARLWEARRQLSPTTRAMARHKISEDVVVPRRHVADLLDDVRRISDETGVRMLTYGHAGDGNLHVNFLWDDPEQAGSVKRGLDALFRAVIGYRGTLTGEHGVGTSKAEFLPLEQSAELIALQRQLKDVFDPRGVLNPGKIFPARGHGAC